MEEKEDFIFNALKDYFGESILPNGQSIQKIDYANILAAKIDYLIANDFNGLFFILYRLDVNEKKVKEMIAQSGGLTPGLTIANLILKRLEEKVYWRNKFKNQSEQIIDEEERW